MKIALVTDKFIYGGGLEHIYQLCKGLPEVEFGVFGKSGYAEHKFDDLDNVTIFSDYSMKSIYDFKPSWVHIHHLRPLMKLYSIDIPKIFTVHGVHIHKFEFKKGLLNFFKKRVRMLFENFLYKRVDKLLFVSKEDETFVKSLYKGLKSTEVIYNGIDFNRMKEISDTKENLIDKLNYSRDKINILTVARFDFPKGHDILQKTLSKIDSALLEKFHFYFVGDGPLLDEQKQLNIDLNLSDLISFIGKKTNIGEYMKASDYFLLPSRWEGLPITLIESLCCGLPILASDTYGNREVCNAFPENSKLLDCSNDLDFERILHVCISKSISDNIDMEKLETTFGINQMLYSIKRVYEI